MEPISTYDDLCALLKRVVNAWLTVSIPWKQAAFESGDNPLMCISASGACHEVLKGEFDLEAVYPLPVDIEQFDLAADEWKPVVVHPAVGSAVGANAYNGHLALKVVHDERSLVVDPDQGRIGELIDGEATIEVDGTVFRYTARPDHQDFVNTESWEKKGFAATWLAAALKQ